MSKCLLPALLATLPLASLAAQQAACERWSEPQRVGALDNQLLVEASGIAVSRTAPQLYHHNDGREPLFYVTAPDGSEPRAVRVAGFEPLDLEDMALGPCGDGRCLYLADIGDNAERRQGVQIAVIAELERFGAEVTPLRVIRARYPSGAHDAEAIAIHPSGDLLLVTKARMGAEAPALLFRLRAASLAADGEQTFEALGEIPVPQLTSLGSARRRIVTAMDIAPDGGRFMLLTYVAAIEVARDPTQPLPGRDEWLEGRTHRAVPIEELIQAEAIAYDRDGRSILYSTESVIGTPIPLMRQSCLE